MMPVAITAANPPGNSAADAAERGELGGHRPDRSPLAGSAHRRYNAAMQQSQSLEFPHDQPPAPGELIEIASGVQWLRLPLPYRLNHVNIYLIRDEGGWAVLDTGLGTAECRAGWEAVLSGPLAGQRLTRMIVTHYHPDHVGLAGWLSQRFGLELSMPRPEYLYSLALQYAPGDLGADMHRPFYHRHGLSPEITELVLESRARISAPHDRRADHLSPHPAWRRAAASARGASRCSPAAATRWSRRCWCARRKSCSSPPTR